MPLNQRETGVDLHGESLAKEKKREQRRQLKAAQKCLNTQLPVTAKLAYDAQIYANQGAGYPQTGSTSAAAASVAAPVDYGQNHDQNYDENSYDHLNTVDNQFVADNIYATTYNYACGSYQPTANGAVASNYQQDQTTDQLMEIIDPKKKKKVCNRL